MLLSFLQDLCARNSYFVKDKIFGKCFESNQKTFPTNSFVNLQVFLHIAFKRKYFSKHKVNVVLNVHFMVLFKIFIILWLFINLISASKTLMQFVFFSNIDWFDYPRNIVLLMIWIHFLRSNHYTVTGGFQKNLSNARFACLTPLVTAYFLPLFINSGIPKYLDFTFVWNIRKLKAGIQYKNDYQVTMDPRL